SALFNLLTVTRSNLSSTSEAALVQLDIGSSLTLGGANPFAEGATTVGRALNVVSSATSGTVAPSSASVALAGPLLTSNKANIISTGSLITILNGATLSSTTAAPLLSLTDTNVTTGTPSI